MNERFEIKILRKHWIKDDGKDDPKDLCLHGELYVSIGEQEILNHKSGSWTLSTTGLYLMRTLKQDYQPEQYDSQLIPCCGHFFMADEAGNSVIIVGCNRGIDWTIEHLGNNKVKHITQNGEVGIIDRSDYQKIVIDFVNEVEAFYNKSKPKVVPEDDFSQKGYKAFWQEWKKLKVEITS